LETVIEKYYEAYRKIQLIIFKSPKFASYNKNYKFKGLCAPLLMLPDLWRFCFLG